jgi:hypothetical protein
VESVVRSALAGISSRNIDYRETLRGAMLDRLDLASDNQIEFLARSIVEWVGPDLIQLDKFEKIFQLVAHSNRRIQNAALLLLKQRVSNEKYHDSLAKADIATLIQSLSNAINVEAISFAALSIRHLALTLARRGQVRQFIQLLGHGVPDVRESASVAIQRIADGSEQDRRSLFNEEILEWLSSGDASSATQIQLSAYLIPKLAITYVHEDKAQLIFNFVEYVHTIITDDCL